MAASRWNIAVFEAFRVVELVIKGMICLSGHAPRHTHELDRLVEDFESLLGRTKTTVPYLFALEATNGDCFGVLFAQGCIYLQKRTEGSYTTLGSVGQPQLALDDLLRLRLEVDGSEVAIYHGDEVLLSTWSLSVKDPVRIVRGFTKQPDHVRIARLKQAAVALRTHREAAFFGVAAYRYHEAERAVVEMDEALNAATAFVD